LEDQEDEELLESPFALYPPKVHSSRQDFQDRFSVDSRVAHTSNLLSRILSKHLQTDDNEGQTSLHHRKGQ
jgi:hypothetical protein